MKLPCLLSNVRVSVYNTLWVLLQTTSERVKNRFPSDTNVSGHSTRSDR